eukprot:CAMPEP_0197867026 /NCGR_PEP_ID=MMETSP1438-20131217/44533_1 /TAXON_ID=1461541 /ORGANISM="Pterosperma sp., Strain CCMP1384" /LENGTH=355 /DNA_ID=CAMNT_0043485643 /DNA_START=590 /DNA_END=1657 /DNA_ORIENTATION=-
MYKILCILSLVSGAVAQQQQTLFPSTPLEFPTAGKLVYPEIGGKGNIADRAEAYAASQELVQATPAQTTADAFASSVSVTEQNVQANAPDLGSPKAGSKNLLAAPSRPSSKSQPVIDLHHAGYPGLTLEPVSMEPLRIALVANGKSVLRKKMGKQIDAHDVVCRFNYFKTKGYEEFVGNKLTYWFLGELKEPGPRGTRGVLGPKGGIMDLKRHPKKYIVPIVYPTPKSCASRKNTKSCAPKGGDLKYRKTTLRTVKNSYAKYKLEPLEILSIQVEQLLQIKYGYTAAWPSSGILAIVWCLEAFPNATLSTYGYDFGKQGLGHYWEKIKKKTTVHDMKNEFNFQNTLIKTGRVTRL